MLARRERAGHATSAELCGELEVFKRTVWDCIQYLRGCNCFLSRIGGKQGAFNCDIEGKSPIA
ncbi:hypothetical protein GCM10027040_36030 [Halomonas shantousis]